MNYLTPFFFKVFFLIAIIAIIAFSAVKAYTQPTLSPHELNIEYITSMSCFSEMKAECGKSKLTASILSGTLMDRLQTTMIYKLSGDKGKLGGQSWLKINKFIWLGWETTSDLMLELDHELFAAVQLPHDDFTFITFGSMHLQQETLGSIGVILYYQKLIKLGFEVKYQEDLESPLLGILAGFQLSAKDFKEFFNPKEEEIEELQLEDFLDPVEEKFSRL